MQDASGQGLGFAQGEAQGCGVTAENRDAGAEGERVNTDPGFVNEAGPGKEAVGVAAAGEDCLVVAIGVEAAHDFERAASDENDGRVIAGTHGIIRENVGFGSRERIAMAMVLVESPAAHNYGAGRLDELGKETIVVGNDPVGVAVRRGDKAV